MVARNTLPVIFALILYAGNLAGNPAWESLRADLGSDALPPRERALDRIERELYLGRADSAYWPQFSAPDPELLRLLNVMGVDDTLPRKLRVRAAALAVRLARGAAAADDRPLLLLADALFDERPWLDYARAYPPGLNILDERSGMVLRIAHALRFSPRPTAHSANSLLVAIDQLRDYPFVVAALAEAVRAQIARAPAVADRITVLAKIQYLDALAFALSQLGMVGRGARPLVGTLSESKEITRAKFPASFTRAREIIIRAGAHARQRGFGRHWLDADRGVATRAERRTALTEFSRPLDSGCPEEMGDLAEEILRFDLMDSVTIPGN